MTRTLILWAYLLSACGHSATHSHSVEFSKADSDNGSITIVFSSPAPAVIVALEGKIVSEGTPLKRLRINNVPSGFAELAVAAGGVERKLRVWVDAGENTSVPMSGPPPAPKQSPLLQAGLSIFALFVSRAATEWIF